MRVLAALLTLVALSASSGCLDPHPNSARSSIGQRFPSAATPVEPPPNPHGVLAISSLVVTFYGEYMVADYTLTETSGQSSVILESMTLEESGGRSDFLDEWCWGTGPIYIAPRSSVDPKWPLLGDYCELGIATKTPGDVATLIVIYRQHDGTRETVRASVPIRRG